MMISADTSSLSSFLKKADTPDAALVKSALLDERLVLTPVVVSEIFSSPYLSEQLESALEQIPMLDLKPGFWKRAGKNRSILLAAGKKARLADSLIATCCLDYGIPLIASDSDYRHFTEHFDLLVKSGIHD